MIILFVELLFLCLIIVDGFVIQSKLCSNDKRNIINSNIKILSNNQNNIKLYDANVLDFTETEGDNDGDDIRSDEEKGLTHGYEGDFKVGDVVKVKISTTIYSVADYRKEGFDPQGLQGIIHELVLYGRKEKSLCSAITPIKVKFDPAVIGTDALSFKRPFFLHFAGDELEKI